MIPFHKPRITAERIAKAILDNMAEGVMSNGENCRRLEERVGRMSGADYAIACSSCTQGLIIALGAGGASGIGQTQSFTWKSTGLALQEVCHDGMLYQDIDYERWTALEYPALTSHGVALAVDTFGTQFVPESKVPLFFDRAHSMGQRFRRIGLASVLSMSPSKPATAGEGGIILTDQEKFAQAYCNARDTISRLSETNAIVGLEDLKNISELMESKKSTYDAYRKAFPQFHFQQGESNHQVIGMLVDTNEQREKIMATVKEVELKAYYEPLHLMTKGWKRPLPVTEDVARRIVCLPSWYGAPIDAVVEHIREAIE